MIADDTIIHLEDFYSFKTFDPASNYRKYIRNLNVGLSLPPSDIRVPIEEFYERSVQNFKAEMPQLRWIKLYNGYTYFPENG